MHANLTRYFSASNTTCLSWDWSYEYQAIMY